MPFGSGRTCRQSCHSLSVRVRRVHGPMHADEQVAAAQPKEGLGRWRQVDELHHRRAAARAGARFGCQPKLARTLPRGGKEGEACRRHNERTRLATRCATRCASRQPREYVHRLRSFAHLLTGRLGELKQQRRCIMRPVEQQGTFGHQLDHQAFEAAGHLGHRLGRRARHAAKLLARHDAHRRAQARRKDKTVTIVAHRRLRVGRARARPPRLGGTPRGLVAPGALVAASGAAV